MPDEPPPPPPPPPSWMTANLFQLSGNVQIVFDKPLSSVFIPDGAFTFDDGQTRWENQGAVSFDPMGDTVFFGVAAGGSGTVGPIASVGAGAMFTAEDGGVLEGPATAFSASVN